MARQNRFTIYDVMEQRGDFDSNPANATARSPEGTPLYAGPQQYPKMLYHPEGAEQILVPAEIIVTPLGPKAVGEQRQIIHQIAHNAQEEAELRAAGWHTHPAGSLRAAGKEAPPTGADQRIAELEKQLEALQAERATLVGNRPAATTAVEGPKIPGPLSKPAA